MWSNYHIINYHIRLHCINIIIVIKFAFESDLQFLNSRLSLTYRYWVWGWEEVDLGGVNVRHEVDEGSLRSCIKQYHFIILTFLWFNYFFTTYILTHISRKSCDNFICILNNDILLYIYNIFTNMQVVLKTVFRFSWPQDFSNNFPSCKLFILKRHRCRLFQCLKVYASTECKQKSRAFLWDTLFI